MRYIAPQTGGSSAQTGFTFIEALVALVILGMTSIPILILLSQSIDQLNKISEATLRAEATRAAIAIIDPINPMDTPNGQMELTDYTLMWSSQELVPPNSNVVIGVGLAGYRVGFYAMEVSFLRDGDPWFSFEARKAGYQRIQASSPFGMATE